MATRVSKEEIEHARQLLLLEMYSEKEDTRHVKRDAIKQLLAPLIAARESGLSFDAIAKIFQKAGLELSPKTLERYYYALKTQDQLKKEALQHAQKLIKLRQELEAKALRTHQEHGNKLALHIAAGSRQQKLFHTLGDAPATDSNNKPVTIARAAKPLPTLPSQKESKNIATDSPRQAGEQATPHTTAYTIDEIERHSQATQARTEICADLEVRDQQRVFYVSGEAFVGTLTKKQIHLLRTTGRIIAASNGKSSQDFVTMRSKI